MAYLIIDVKCEEAHKPLKGKKRGLESQRLKMSYEIWEVFLDPSLEYFLINQYSHHVCIVIWW